MENNEILEGKKIDNLEDTSASETPVEVKEEVKEEIQPEPEPVPSLSASPVPTQAEVEEANLSTEPENVVPNEPIQEEQPRPDMAEPQPEQPMETEPAVGENVEQPQVQEENGVTDLGSAMKFTQSQVNEMVGKTRTETREKTFRYIYDRYGVNDEAELDELIGNAQRYDTLKEEFDNEKKGWKEQSAARDEELTGVKEQIALLESGIDRNRFEDAKFILKGKGLEVSLDNIKNELATHPEWQKKDEAQANPNFAKVGEPTVDTNEPSEPVSKISVLGNEAAPVRSETSEEDFAMNRYFKI